MCAGRYTTPRICIDIDFQALDGIILPFVWRIVSISTYVRSPSKGQLSRLALS